MPAPINWTADNVTECFIQAQWTNGRQVGHKFFIHREEDDPEESARDLLNNWQDHIIPQQMNNYVLNGCLFRDRNIAAGVTGFILPDTGKPTTGGSSSASTTPNVSVLVKKSIVAEVGHRGGLTYHGPCAEAAVDEDGNFDPSTRAAYQASYNDFFGGLNDDLDNSLVIVHLGGGSDQERDQSRVTGMAVQAKVATQRRRLRK